MASATKRSNRLASWLSCRTTALDRKTAYSVAMDFLPPTTTAHPTLAWVLQQLREATPFGRQPRFLFRDNDRIYGQGVAGFLKSCQMEEVRTAFRCPWQNPFVERFGGSLRREVLDHVIVLNESHLERLLKEYIEEFYHLHRPHQGLEGQTPEPSPRSLQPPSSVIAIPVLGGLHHHYVPVAA
jgi:putative transposase